MHTDMLHFRPIASMSMPSQNELVPGAEGKGVGRGEGAELVPGTEGKGVGRGEGGGGG